MDDTAIEFSSIIPSWVYRRFCKTRRLESHGWNLLRRALLKISDPPCVMTVHGKPMRMPLSHNLPTFLRNNLTYDKLPRRLSTFIRRKYGRVVLVDVGANIGDSTVAFQGDRALAIEANPKFLAYLKRNAGANVTVVECLCSDADGEGFFRAEESHGSAAFHRGGPLKRPIRTVDSLVKEHGFEDFNILKVDTDGHDLEVLTGAKNALENVPAVLFECYAAPSPAANLATLKSLPFKSFLLYSDKGLLMGRHYTSDLSAFEDLLHYAMAADVHFDILLLKEDDMDEFHALEKMVYPAGRNLGNVHGLSS